jgi:cytochrome c oxidase cbb3-type subunit 2/cytochrome c oxidase cbb3-type subunit I/II
MPRWNRLSTSDLEAVAAYMQTIDASGSHEAGNESTVIEQGLDLYRQNCTGCHGMDGRGNGPAAAALAPSPTNFHQERATKEHSLRVLKEGIPGTAMPTWRAELSDAQREAVAAYVDSLYERAGSTK